MTEDKKIEHMGCVVCRRAQFVDYKEENGYVHCASGVICESTGNYGSTVFDPFNGGELMQFLICDDCIKERGRDITVFKYRTRQERCILGKKTLNEYLEKDFMTEEYEAKKGLFDGLSRQE